MCLLVFHNGRVAQKEEQEQDRFSRSTLLEEDWKAYKEYYV